MICASSLILGALTPSPSLEEFPEEIQVAIQCYRKEFEKFLIKWIADYKKIREGLNDPFSIDKICDKRNLLSSRQKWAKAVALTIIYQKEYEKEDERLFNKFLDVCYDPQDRASALQASLEEGPDPMKKMLEIEILTGQKIIMMIDFLLARHGSYEVKDGQITLYTSMEDVVNFNRYSQELGHLLSELDKILEFSH